MRTCRAMGIATVAVYSDADADAPFVRHADEAVRIGPPPARESYLVINALLDQARATMIAEARRIGFPILVKASAGGGGKGMRIVRREDELADAIERARGEAGSAFGDDTLLLERYLERPRHIEIQILGDRHGNVVHLWERECSIQRRHQKVVEEAPSPALHAEHRREMGRSAVEIGRAVGYVG